MLNQALAGREEYHDRTCADMGGVGSRRLGII